MEEHIQKYVKFRTNIDISIEEISNILKDINNQDDNNKFNLTRINNLENYSKNYKYIINNRIPLHYDQNSKIGETYILNSISDNSGIFTIDNFLTIEECKDIINLIDNSKYKHFGFTGSLLNNDTSKMLNGKKSIDMDINDFMCEKYCDDKSLFEKYNKKILYKLNKIALNFKNYYLWPGNESEYYATDITMRRYIKNSGGYDYHNDFLFQGSLRLMTFIIYLNDVYDGGDTKFLHQDIKIKPLAGKLLIFPPTHLHIHVGMPAKSNDKYIITSFFEKKN